MDKPTPQSDPTDAAVANAESKLSRLGVQVEAMQAALVRLLQDVVRAERQLEQTQVAQMVEANEKLVLAAMASQAETDTVAAALDEVAHEAVLDALTRLPNRAALVDRCAQAIAHARRNGPGFAVLFLDLDNFKQLNDAHGHAFGDEVLRLVADRMVATVRAVDTVSRHGGDEFVVLLVEGNQPRDAPVVADKLLEAIAAPAQVSGVAVNLTASIGMAFFPDDGQDIETLVARADAAMYASKRRHAGDAARAAAPPAQPVAAVPPGVAAPPRSGSVASANTDASKWHAEMREANERLVLAALTAQELREAAELARQRQAAFMAAVAGELANPMAPIRIATAMLGRVPGDEPLLPHVQHIVEQRLAYMSRLVGNLVEASSVEAGGFEIDHRWVDLGAIIDAAIAAYRPTMAERGQRFEATRPPGPLGVSGDAARLGQIVGNLLDNACTHTHEGGRIRLSVTVAADTLTLTVADDGIGITPQMLPYVFEPFVQDDHALGFNGTGLGIGLTVVRALVRAHGGNLVAHSAGARRGSQFVVTLPLAAGAAPVAAAAAADAGAGATVP
jgi:diguanylate cyclase (GGDEF)-like protein